MEEVMKMISNSAKGRKIMRFFRHGIIGLSFWAIGLLFLWQPLPASGQGSAPATGKPALYEFGAGYCASCKEMEKIMAELKTTHSDQVEFRLIYVDKEKPLFEHYKIMLIPTQVFLDARGKEVDRHIGPLTKEEVLSKLKELKLLSK
jgi:thioredoxin 1